MGYSDSMVIAMEDVPTSFLSFLESRAPLTRANLLTFMKPIAQILTVAGERYGFRHGDLHWGNLMFAADGSPKLIDFGKSCVTVDGVTYAATPANCESYDMLILYASLLERASFQPSQFTTDAVEMLRSLFHGTDGIDYYQTLLNWFTAMKGKISATALFHVFYHDVAIGLNSPSEPDWAIRRRQPWTLVLELTRLAKPGEKTFYDAFVAAGIPAATEPAAMVISLDAMKGGRLNVTRRQPKAARRFKQ
jgi:serine/threonine protein kinase